MYWSYQALKHKGLVGEAGSRDKCLCMEGQCGKKERKSPSKKFMKNRLKRYDYSDAKTF